MDVSTETAAGIAQLLPEGARLERLATGATWSEGPVWLPAQRTLRWSDIPANRILEYSVDDRALRVYAEDAEYTNGRTLDLAGQVVQCSHGHRRIERDTGGRVTAIVSGYASARLNSPNDVVVADDGAIWFSDPPYGIAGTGEGHVGEREYGDCYVFRYDERTGDLRPAVTDVEEPNGLAFSPDGSLLYVSDTSAASRADGNHHIRVYDVIDGRCKNGRLFAVVEPGLPDGFRVDERGNVWTSAADGVHVLAPNGTELGRLPVPETVGNLCFGGTDGRYLFVAASSSLYGVQTRVRGAADRARWSS